MNIKYVSSPVGFFHAAYSELGLKMLCFLGAKPSQYTHDETLQQHVDNFFSNTGLVSLPSIDLQGTNFQLRVWNALCAIPRGSTASYLSIAKKIGSPGASRAVGTA